MHRSVLRSAVYRAKVVPGALQACQWVCVVLRLHGSAKPPHCVLGLQTLLGPGRELQFRLALQVPGVAPQKLQQAAFVGLERSTRERDLLRAIDQCQFLALGPAYRGLFSYQACPQVLATFFLRAIRVSLDAQLVPTVEWTGTANPIHVFELPEDRLRVS